MRLVFLFFIVLKFLKNKNENRITQSHSRLGVSNKFKRIVNIEQFTKRIYCYSV